MAEDTAEGLKDAIRVDTAELRGARRRGGALECGRDAQCAAAGGGRQNPLGEMIRTLAGAHDTRAGSYERKLETKAGVVTLKVPKLRRCRLRRRSSSVIGGGNRRSRKRWWRCTWRE